MDAKQPRSRLRRQADALALIADDEALFDELVSARGAEDGSAFLATLGRIPLPDDVSRERFCLEVCEELDSVHLISVDRLVWANSGRPFDEAAARADLQAQKNAPAISDEVWAAVVQWLLNSGVIRIETTQRPDPAYPTPIRCYELCFGGQLPLPS